MCWADGPARQAEQDQRRARQHVIPGRGRRGAAQQPGGGDDPGAEQDVQKAHRPPDVRQRPFALCVVGRGQAVGRGAGERGRHRRHEGNDQVMPRVHVRADPARVEGPGAGRKQGELQPVDVEPGGLVVEGILADGIDVEGRLYVSETFRFQTPPAPAGAGANRALGATVVDVSSEFSPRWSVMARRSDTLRR